MKAETLIGKTPNLQAPSPTVVRLLTLLNNENADYDEVISTVGRDAVLSAKLLALCNSVSYGLAQPVASLEQGVLYLGYGEIHRLVMALSFGSQIGVELPGYDMDSGTLWRHSLTVGLLTPRVLAMSKRNSVDTSVAYTAGLLHDIGKLVIGQTLETAQREKIHQLVESREASLLDAEKTVIGCDHAEIGGCLLHHWRIPDVIVEAVTNHHKPPAGKNDLLSAAIHLADATAHQTGASPGWESFAVARHDSALALLNLATVDMDNLIFGAIDCQEKVAQQERITSRKSVPENRDVAGGGF